jgi:arginyl-tRNA synthetase
VVSPAALIDQAVRQAAPQLRGWPDGERSPQGIVVERTQNPEHGDYSITLPLKLARTLRRPPMEIAEELKAAVTLPEGFARIAIASPGFINLRVEPGWLQGQLEAIASAGQDWGRVDLGQGMSVQVEFVSSNPTGPMLFSHARGAVVGDVLARLLDATGYAVQREYYVNDAGNQVRLFGESIRARILGEPVPEGGYTGAYVSELAKEIAPQAGDAGSLNPSVLAELGIEKTIQLIRSDLDRLGIRHDKWFLESSMYAGWDKETITKLRAAGRVGEKDGAVWFLTGSDKDEVLYKRSGEPTYFAADIFYHRDKFERRGFARVIDVWGADHQGQVVRLKQALQVLGIDPERLTVLLVQLVSVKRGQESVRMSRRAGVGISLREMLDEVGPDALRYFFLLRSADAQMQFDVDLAKQQSNENPVFYAQYAHARLSNVLAFGGRPAAEVALDRLDSEWELELMRTIVRWPDVVREAAEALEPHRLAFYCDEVAAAVHRFYKNCRVVTDDAPLTAARLLLSRAARTTIGNALGLMGVSAPERM